MSRTLFVTLRELRFDVCFIQHHQPPNAEGQAKEAAATAGQHGHDARNERQCVALEFHHLDRAKNYESVNCREDEVEDAGERAPRFLEE